MKDLRGRKEWPRKPPSITVQEVARAPAVLSLGLDTENVIFLIFIPQGP